MDSPTPCLAYPAYPAIKQILRMLHMDLEELMDYADDFSEFVKELKDYSWRLTEKEKRFLESVFRYQERLKADLPFIEMVGNVEWCHREVVDSVANQAVLVKETMRVQEEILELCFNEEGKVDKRIDELGKEFKPLLKRKKALQDEIHRDVTKLLSRRHSLNRLQDKQRKLDEESQKIKADSEMAEMCRSALENMNHEVKDVAKNLDGPDY